MDILLTVLFSWWLSPINTVAVQSILTFLKKKSPSFTSFPKVVTAPDNTLTQVLVLSSGGPRLFSLLSNHVEGTTKQAVKVLFLCFLSFCRGTKWGVFLTYMYFLLYIMSKIIISHGIRQNIRQYIVLWCSKHYAVHDHIRYICLIVVLCMKLILNIQPLSESNRLWWFVYSDLFTTYELGFTEPNM